MRSGVQVPLVDLVAQFRSIRDEVMPALEEVLSSAQLFLGPNTQAFETEFAQLTGARFCTALSNGTDALHLALRAAGVGPGDEVITVSHTFIATIEAIVQAGARPVLVDIDPRTYTIAVDQIEDRITSKTKAIIPVHLYGRMCDMPPVLEIARRHDLVVIEDASQAHGAIDAQGGGAGSIGQLGTFSFYYAKNLGAYGEAGAVTTSDPRLDQRIKLLRSHGESVRYEHEVLGFNARPDELQSAVLRIKLQHLQEWNRRRRHHAAAYHELLHDSSLGLPEFIEDGSHVYHQYVVRARERDSVLERLRARGIGAAIHYPVPVHLQRACAFLGYSEGDLPQTERAAREILSLPMYPELTPEQIEYVATHVMAEADASVRA
jgi:dTDP-4-amino-4,6-dideoxygalactose transaminase